LAQELPAAYELSQAIKEQAEQYVEETLGDTWAESWMYAILGEINFYEIAENYLGK
jgi:NTP pyrophosphatase (non-canonical NTP hydrolase)